MVPNLSKPNVVFNLKSKIYTKLNVLDDGMCNELIKFGESNINKGVNKYPHLFQTSFHSCLLPLGHTIHDKLQHVWEEIINYFNFDISFIEPYEIKRYTDGDFFGKHVDNYYGLDINLERKITISIQLSDDLSYNGGKLKILNTMSSLSKGSVTAFPSFFPHEVLKTTGCRWALIGWAWGPYWK